MPYTSLNFSMYGTDFDLASYGLESTLLLFPNNTPVPSFLFCMRTASNHKHDLWLVQFWTFRWAVQNWSVFVTSSFF